MLIDEAHFNLHTLWGSYRPLADFLARDGYVVRSASEPFTREILDSAGVLVVSTAMSANLVSPSASLAVSSRRGDEQAKAFPALTSEEVAAVRDWVANGGALLLIGNHNPYPASIQNLAEAFGIRFSNCGATNPSVGSGRLMFRRSAGSRGEVPDVAALIAQGDTVAADEALERMITRTGDGMSYGDGGILTDHAVNEGIDSVATFLGSAFRIDGPHEPLLVFGPGVACFDQTSLQGWVGGQLQGALLEFGGGRLAVFGEAGMFTSQVVGLGGTKMGMNDPIAPQNAAFVLQVMHWLTKLGERR